MSHVMLTATQIAGFIGAGLAGAAYVPQIYHLIRARCSAGISRLAFEVWLLASVLTTARAMAIHAAVFIVLGGIEIVATMLIMFYAARYKDTTCPVHLRTEPQTTDPKGDDMTAEPQAAIVIVSRDPDTREILDRELSKRYGADYQIVVCDSPKELAPR